MSVPLAERRMCGRKQIRIMKKKNSQLSQIASTTRAQHRLNARQIGLVLVLFALAPSAFAQPHRSASPPAVAPRIAHRYPNDIDSDGIDDQLLDRARKAIEAENGAITTKEKSAAAAQL